VIGQINILLDLHKQGRRFNHFYSQPKFVGWTHSQKE